MPNKNPETYNRKKTKSRAKIIFDKEVIPKSKVNEFVANDLEPFTTIVNKQNTPTKSTNEASFKEQKRKRKKNQNSKSDCTNVEGNSTSNFPDQQTNHLKKKKKAVVNEKSNESKNNDTVSEEIAESQLNKDFELNSTNTTIKKEESKRAQKRKKHQELLVTKKLKTDIVLQTKSLNYVSQWKHNRNEWKFEKLRQIWLQQNMFDLDKVPQEFWQTVVEYFGNSKGRTRQIVLDEALKIIEREDSKGESEQKEENVIAKAQRCRDILQYLQE